MIVERNHAVTMILMWVMSLHGGIVSDDEIGGTAQTGFDRETGKDG